MKRHSKSRTGIAPLEFVMALPLIAAVWVLLMWLGKAVIAQAQVTAEARRQAVSERFEVKGGKPLRFLENGLATGDETTLVKKVDQKIAGNRLTRNLPTPESSFMVQAGTWDHRQVALDDAPSWEEITTIAIGGGLSGVQNAIAEVKNIANDPGDFASGAFASLGGSSGGLGGGGADVPNGTSLSTDNSDVDPEKLRARRAAADAKLRQLEPELREARLNLLKLNAEAAGETITLDDDELRSVREQIAIEENRIWRLQRDIDYYRTERDNANRALS